MSTSVYLPESVHPRAAEVFESRGITSIIRYAETDIRRVIGSLGSEDILGIHNTPKFSVPKGVLAIGQYGVGLSGLEGGEQGFGSVAVFEAPYVNGRSIAEFVIYNIYNLSREFGMGTEVRGKTLGIVGFGNVGRQLAALAEANNMHVVFVDKDERLVPGSVEKLDTLNELLMISDFVSIHTDAFAFDADALTTMKEGSYLINTHNTARIDYDSLGKSKVSGLVLDTNDTDGAASAILAHKDVVYSYNKKANTEQAVVGTAEVISGRIMDYVQYGAVTESASLPNTNVQTSAGDGQTRVSYIHENYVGAAAEFTRALSERGFNIPASEIVTKGQVGYAVADIDGELTLSQRSELSAALSSLRHAIRARII